MTCATRRPGRISELTAPIVCRKLRIEVEREEMPTGTFHRHLDPWTTRWLVSSVLEERGQQEAGGQERAGAQQDEAGNRKEVATI